MSWFKKRIKKNGFKTDTHKIPEKRYESKIKEIDNFLEKNENMVLESRNNLYIEERERLIPHKPKYSGRNNYSL